MRKFHPLTVAEIRAETPDSRLVRFTVPAELHELYRYREGQHLTLKARIGDEEVRRSYSICASAAEQRLEVVVRHVPGGRFSGHVMEHLKPGDEIEIFPPAGRFNLPPAEGRGPRHFVFFAAGSGITPVMSLIETALESEPGARVSLFYGNRDGASTIFREAISALKNRHMERFAFWHFLTRQQLEIPFFRGRLDGAKVGDILDTLLRGHAVDHWFVCGPDSMIDDIEATLGLRGIARETVHSERFLNEGQPAGLAAGQARETGSHARASRISAILDGTVHEVEYAPGAGSVLEALAAAGLDVPFSCKGGVCTTCRAKLREGTAEMAVNYGLEPDEVAAGYILTCQAVPTGERLVISYDD